MLLRVEVVLVAFFAISSGVLRALVQTLGAHGGVVKSRERCHITGTLPHHEGVAKITSRGAHLFVVLEPARPPAGVGVRQAPREGRQHVRPVDLPLRS